MVFVRGFLVAATALSFAGSALGQAEAETEATKQAAFSNMLPNSYGNLEIRHATSREQVKSDVINDDPVLTVRPTLGSTFFDKKVDTSFTWIFQKKAGDAKVTKDALYNVTTYELLKGDYGSVLPYAETYLSSTGDFSASYSGVNLNASHTFKEAAAGDIKIGSYSYILGKFTSKSSEDDVGVKIEPQIDGFALRNSVGAAAEEDVKIPQRTPSIFSYSGIYTKYTPAALSAVAVSAEIELDRHFDPKYKTVKVSDEYRFTDDGYSVKTGVINKLKVAYKFDNGVEVGNQLRHYVNGYWQDGTGSEETRWQNRLTLTSTLF
jgi:hypothetical protein